MKLITTCFVFALANTSPLANGLLRGNVVCGNLKRVKMQTCCANCWAANSIFSCCATDNSDHGHESEQKKAEGSTSAADNVSQSCSTVSTVVMSQPVSETTTVEEGKPSDIVDVDFRQNNSTFEAERFGDMSATIFQRFRKSSFWKAEKDIKRNTTE